MLAAGALLGRARRPCRCSPGVFGIGCDGELTPAEVLERLAEVAARRRAGRRARAHRAGGGAPRGRRGGGAHRGERPGAALLPGRAGRGHHPRAGGAPCSSRPLGASTVYVDPVAAVGSAARLAAAVRECPDLEAANGVAERASACAPSSTWSVRPRTQARPLRRETEGMLKRLPDGTQILIRPIRPDDKRMLEQGLHNLSETSVQRRFLTPKPQLQPLRAALPHRGRRAQPRGARGRAPDAARPAR